LNFASLIELELDFAEEDVEFATEPNSTNCWTESNLSSSDLSIPLR
jgi:hypothetical protein